VVDLLAYPDDVPTLENFAHGDTPTPEALQGLVEELLSGGPELEVDLYALGNRHDLRPLVLRTALTYLELEGVLRQGTPFYAGYKVQPLVPLEQVLARFEGERRSFLEALFAQSKKGRTWYTVDPRAAAEALGQPRERVVKALDYLQEQGLAQTQVSEPRQRYTRLRAKEDAGALVAGLLARYEQRERAEVQRIQQVLSLVTHAGCQNNALVAHFGQQRAKPCGHCTFCLTGEAQRLPETEAQPPLAAEVDSDALAALVSAQPGALGAARQQARFLCGITSPATTRAKLTRNDLFGVAAGRRFDDVLAWCTEAAM